MSQDANSVCLCGRLVDSMQLRTTQNQYPIGNFTLAVNRSQKQKDGTWKDKASFFDCTLYGSSAKNLQLYLCKGKQVVITGYLEQDRWEKEGQKYSRVRVVVENIQLVGGGNQTRNSSQNTPPQQAYINAQPEQIAEDNWSQSPIDDGYLPEEIPF